jgi:phenylalanyl-tRNA synthetase alpha chain
MAVDIESLQKDFKSQLERVRVPEDLEILRRDWLGKEGTLKRLFKELGGLSAEERPKIATGLNQLRDEFEATLKSESARYEARALEARLETERQDLSLPGRNPGKGALHPISHVERALIKVLKHYGLEVSYGPEVEEEYFCFDSLNIPKHHPARDMQDTFFTNEGRVLRTHTTSVQARALKKGGLPIKILSPGRVFRNESADASHTAMFHQFELIWLDKGLTLANLMGVMMLVARELYGNRRRIRFKPKYYPYTEPSVGLDVALDPVPGEPQGWVTVVGAGVIHRKVLQEFGYDPEEVSGIAFGFGTTRLAVERFNLRDARAIYENDLRVLKGLVL